MPVKKSKKALRGIEKSPTGIKGIDLITYGGIPKGRPTLICGNAGSGKTMMALEMLIHGALEFNEPGVILSFEESREDLIKNIASMGFDLEELERKNLIHIDHIQVDMKEYFEAGEYDLEGLFIRIQNAVNKIGAKRIAIDTIEILFSGFLNEALLRSELKRLFDWLKDKGLTAILTGEQGSLGKLTRYGIEEYVADCVISLTSVLSEDLNTRRLQIVKYRGAFHETNQFPFIIGHRGIILLPITSLEMKAKASTQQISTGVPELDTIMGGGGYYEGSSILLTGSSGSGKTTLAAAFARSLIQKKKKCLFISYEESESEIIRNLKAVNIDLEQKSKEKHLKIISSRPTQYGLETHLGNFLQSVEEYKPYAVVIDPVSTLSHCGSPTQVYSILSRMIDYLKNRNITFFMTMLYVKEQGAEFTYGISSVIDTWISLRNEEVNGELNRDLLIVKSRGMKHSNQVREFALSSKGIEIKEPYYGEAGVLTGSSRIVQEHKDMIEKLNDINALKNLQKEIELKKKLIEIQIKSLKTELEFKESEAKEKEQLLQLKEEISNTTKDDLMQRRSFLTKKTSSKVSHAKKRRKN